MHMKFLFLFLNLFFINITSLELDDISMDESVPTGNNAAYQKMSVYEYFQHKLGQLNLVDHHIKGAKDYYQWLLFQKNGKVFHVDADKIIGIYSKFSKDQQRSHKRTVNTLLTDYNLPIYVHVLYVRLLLYECKCIWPII